MSGTVLVAHNLSFDARFLDAEFDNAGLPVPDDCFELGLCTMRMSHRYLQGAGRSLQDCCDSFGIDLTGAHSAAGDATAAAVLLSRYMELDHASPEWDERLRRATAAGWFPARPAARIPTCPRPRGVPAPAEHFLDRLARTLPQYPGSAAGDNYLAVLDQAMMDRYLSAHEEAQLLGVARELGLDRDAALELHEYYFGQLVDAAWSDGQLAEDERADLERVAALLGITDETLAAAQCPPSRPTAPPRVAGTAASSTIPAGSLVVLTGEMSRSRAQIEDRLRQAGFVPHGAITKKVGLLVAADPDSLSGKARKARDYGIPVVGEDYLWSTLLRE